MNTRSIARLGTLAVGLGIGAAWAHMPVASADTSNDWLSAVDSLLSGASPAADPAVTDFQISFNGVDLFSQVGNEATATTVAGQFGLAIAIGDGASATAEGGTGDSALADGTDALAKAGSTTAGATGFNFDSATDIGNNTRDAGTTGAPDGAYAGGGSLIGGTDSGVSTNDTAQFIGNGGVDTETGYPGDGGNSGAFAGDSALIGDGATKGSGDTAYTSGNIEGFGDGSAAVAGSNDSAYTTGTETGTNEGAFSGFGNNNSATADTNYAIDDKGVDATDGNGNYAFVDGPNNSTADASGGSDVAYINDPFSGATATADSAVAGDGSFTNDLAEVLLTHGNATADSANLLYDIVSLFGTFTGSL
jgi:hypothetical protein